MNIAVPNFRSPLKVFLGNKYFLNRISHLSSYAITFKEYGDPNKVLEKIEHDISENLEPNQVLVKLLAAPINPADINVIQGKYAIKPKLPAIGGGEGIAEVIKVGSSVANLKVGVRVIPAAPASGTWKTHDIYSRDDLIEIDGSIPLHNAATIAVNPCTAYRMLKDFCDLEKGDTIIQNGANSAVGQAVIQIAKFLGVNTINVVRDRPDLESLKSFLNSLGATHVVAENELRTPVMTDIFKQIQKPTLGFNCVGGKSAAELIRHLTNKGTLVTYGGMSKLPLTISTASLIFNDIRLMGFWMSRWVKDHSKQERCTMLNEITDVIKQGGLKPPTFREVDFDNFKEAVAKSMEGFVSEKQILIMK